MDFRELLLANRSFRGYDETRRISREEMLELVELTRYAASSANRQPLKYYVSTEQEEVEKILTLTGWGAMLKPMKLPKDGKHPTAFVVICQDLDISRNLEQYRYDAGIAAEAMLLGATEKGLGGCMIGNFDEDGLAELLELGEDLFIQLVVAFGKPDEEIHLVDAVDGNVKYYRDEVGEVHFVPKRSLEEILL